MLSQYPSGASSGLSKYSSGPARRTRSVRALRSGRFGATGIETGVDAALDAAGPPPKRRGGVQLHRPIGQVAQLTENRLAQIER